MGAFISQLNLDEALKFGGKVVLEFLSGVPPSSIMCLYLLCKEDLYVNDEGHAQKPKTGTRVSDTRHTTPPPPPTPPL